MKKLFAIAVALLAVWAFSTAQTFAKEGAKQAASGPKENHAKALEEAVKELQLTQQQEAQVRQILETHRQAIANWRKENQGKLEELQQQIKAAREAKDAENRKSLVEQRRQLLASRMKLTSNMLKQLGEVLNKEQVAKIEGVLGAMAPRPFEALRNALQSLNLTEAQQTQVKEILAKAREEFRAAMEQDDTDKAGAILREARSKIVKEVLTDAQRQQLEQARENLKDEMRDAFLARLKKLNLTAEQQKKVDEIMAETRKKAQATEGIDAKKAVWREAVKEIRQQVLTKEQREQLAKDRAESKGSTSKGST